MKPSMKFWLLAAGIALLDQATKNIVLHHLDAESEISFLGSYGRIVLVSNPGAAFGSFQAFPRFFLLLTICAVAGLAWYRLRARVDEGLYPLGLVLGGAFGNLVDRIRFGHVIDFLDFGIGHTRWPAFNCADAAITIGVLLLVFPWPAKDDNDGAAPAEGPREGGA